MQTTATLVSDEELEQLMESFDDDALGAIIKERQVEKPFAIELTLDEL